MNNKFFNYKKKYLKYKKKYLKAKYGFLIDRPSRQKYQKPTPNFTYDNNNCCSNTFKNNKIKINRCEHWSKDYINDDDKCPELKTGLFVSKIEKKKLKKCLNEIKKKKKEYLERESMQVWANKVLVPRLNDNYDYYFLVLNYKNKTATLIDLVGKNIFEFNYIKKEDIITDAIFNNQLDSFSNNNLNIRPSKPSKAAYKAWDPTIIKEIEKKLIKRFENNNNIKIFRNFKQPFWL